LDRATIGGMSASHSLAILAFLATSANAAADGLPATAVPEIPDARQLNRLLLP
jgi:hypothetical protein